MIILDIISALALIVSMVYIAGLFLFSLPYRRINEKKKFPLVSIIMATKNEEAVIEKTLKALKKINYPKFEIIVADSSTDRTARIARKYARVITDRHASKSHALNLAVKRSRSKVLYIIDADTVVEKGTLKKLVSALDSKYDAVAGLNIPENRQNIVTYISRMGLAHLNYFQKSINRIIKTSVIPGRNFVICKKVLEGVGGFKDVLTEDVNLSLRLYKIGKKIDIMPAVCREKVPERMSWYLRQQERWVAGSMAEIKSALGHISLYEKYVSLPCILLLISLPGIMVLSALAYSITYAIAFLVLTAIAFLTMLFSSLRYLDVQDAVLSPIFSTAYGLIFLFTIAVVASKKLRGKEIKWYKTPR